MHARGPVFRQAYERSCDEIACVAQQMQLLIASSKKEGSSACDARRGHEQRSCMCTHVHVHVHV